MDIFIEDNKNFNYDFLIGLDCIKKFKLIQNEKLKVIQYNNPEEKNEISNEEDSSNLIYNKIPDVLGEQNTESFLFLFEKQETEYKNVK